MTERGIFKKVCRSLEMGTWKVSTDSGQMRWMRSDKNCAFVNRTEDNNQFTMENMVNSSNWWPLYKVTQCRREGKMVSMTFPENKRRIAKIFIEAKSISFYSVVRLGSILCLWTLQLCKSKNEKLGIIYFCGWLQMEKPFRMRIIISRGSNLNLWHFHILKFEMKNHSSIKKHIWI